MGERVRAVLNCSTPHHANPFRTFTFIHLHYTITIWTFNGHLKLGKRSEIGLRSLLGGFIYLVSKWQRAGIGWIGQRLLTKVEIDGTSVSWSTV